MASHTSKCWLPRNTTSVHYTHPFPSYPCAYPICATHHPCPLSAPTSCGSPFHDCTYSRRCSLWSSRCCIVISVSLSGSSIPRNHRAATTHEDDGAATTRHESAIQYFSEIIQLRSKVIQRKPVNKLTIITLPTKSICRSHCALRVWLVSYTCAQPYPIPNY